VFAADQERWPLQLDEAQLLIELDCCWDSGFELFCFVTLPLAFDGFLVLLDFCPRGAIVLDHVITVAARYSTSINPCSVLWRLQIEREEKSGGCYLSTGNLDTRGSCEGEESISRRLVYSGMQMLLPLLVDR
jgi:hypothetical protein